MIHHKRKGRKAGGWEGMKGRPSPFLLFQNKRVMWALSSPFWTTTIWSNKNHDSFRIRITWRPWSKGKKKWGSPNRRLLNFDNQAEKKGIKSPLFPPKSFFLLSFFFPTQKPKSSTPPILSKRSTTPPLQVSLCFLLVELSLPLVNFVETGCQIIR